MQATIVTNCLYKSCNPYNDCIRNLSICCNCSSHIWLDNVEILPACMDQGKQCHALISELVISVILQYGIANSLIFYRLATGQIISVVKDT